MIDERGRFVNATLDEMGRSLVEAVNELGFRSENYTLTTNVSTVSAVSASESVRNHIVNQVAALVLAPYAVRELLISRLTSSASDPFTSYEMFTIGDTYFIPQEVLGSFARATISRSFTRTEV